MPDKLEKQWPEDVLEFSSQYGNETSHSYTVENLKFGLKKYPSYGDFTTSAVWRTYGPWWKKKRPSQVTEKWSSQDYVDLLYTHEVWPHVITVYETYNPGSIVRVLACNSAPQDLPGLVDNVRWFVLWSGEPQTDLRHAARAFQPKLEQCPFPTRLIRLELNHTHCSYYTEIDAVCIWGYRKQPIGYKLAVHRAQNDLCDEHSIDTDVAEKGNGDNACSAAKPYMICVECGGQRCSEDCISCMGAVNAVGEGHKLVRYCSCSLGYKSKDVQTTLSQQGKTKEFTVAAIKERMSTSLNRITKQMASLHVLPDLTDALAVSDNAYFDLLPAEVTQHIVSLLDLASIESLSCTSHLFLKHCRDWLLYIDVNLQPYWSKVTDHVLTRLANRCRQVRTVNLSWCGPYNHITPAGFARFLPKISADLRCLVLSSCSFINDSCIETIVDNAHRLEELDLSSCLNIRNYGFDSLTVMTTLTRFNCYRTRITTNALVTLILNNRNLEDLNMGSCRPVQADDVAQALAINCKQLKVVNFWRCVSLGVDGFEELITNCTQLEEIDLGWCSGLRHADSLLQDMANNCRQIKKIFLTAHRSVCDTDILAFACYLPNLRQVDLLGTNMITDLSINKLLEQCPKLELLDISFCYKLADESVARWRNDFPHVDIKRSFQD